LFVLVVQLRIAKHAAAVAVATDDDKGTRHGLFKDEYVLRIETKTKSR